MFGIAPCWTGADTGRQSAWRAGSGGHEFPPLDRPGFRRRSGGRGRRLQLDATQFTIVGIAPPASSATRCARSTRRTSFCRSTPSRFSTAIRSSRTKTHWLAVIGRHPFGTSSAAVEAHMRLDLTAWLRAHWDAMSPNNRRCCQRRHCSCAQAAAASPACASDPALAGDPHGRDRTCESCAPTLPP